MLRLRPEQIRVLADAAFANRLTQELRLNFNKQVAHIDHQQLAAQVHEGIALGRRHGLTGESSLGGYTLLRIVIGPDFERQPQARQILSDPNIPPDERIEKLVNSL